MKKGYHRSVWQSLALVTQTGIHMLVPIFLCSFAGLWLDRRFDTSVWFLILFFVGALAGFRNIRILMRKIYEREDEEQC